uniref:uncharacterized protein LOC105353003 n=1 Tax=Fragaria vesca subsp. vesca TaxID=101020 RepID=UPI0005CAC531|nr:PREDICTED: uncharacterized protein LOC105353003 [Fragaria vesca subsp. vesca]
MGRACGRARGGGFRSRSGGASSSKSTTPKSARQLVETYPGAAAVIVSGKRPYYGRGSSDSDDDPYPSLACQDLLHCYYDALRLCGADHVQSLKYKERIRDFCGIEVFPEGVANGSASTSTSAKR